jgi:hypothetical protein
MLLLPKKESARAEAVWVYLTREMRSSAESTVKYLAMYDLRLMAIASSMWDSRFNSEEIEDRVGGSFD